MCTLVAILLTFAAQGPPAHAPDDTDLLVDDQGRIASSVRQILERVTRRMFAAVGDEGYQEHQAYLIAAMQRVYEQNGWNSESDAFSLDLVSEVSAIPPWNMQARFDAISARLADRYLLDPVQEQAMRALVERESNDFLVREGPHVLPIAFEAIQARLMGEPYTAEQVARWSQELAPLFYDARQRLETTSAEVMQFMTPQQRNLLQVDLAAARRRLERLDQLGSKWVDGEWDAGDWGLQDDPIQRGDYDPWHAPTAAAAETQARRRSLEPGASGALPGMESGAETSGDALSGESLATRPVGETDPWAEFVQEFIRRYKLDDAQQKRAWIIYESARQRREFQDLRHARQVERLHASRLADQMQSAALEELQRDWTSTREMIFEAMRRRLDRLPTRAQRRDAAPAAVEKWAESRPVPKPVPAELGGP